MLQLSRATVRAYGAPWRDWTSTCRRSMVSTWFRHGFRSIKKNIFFKNSRKKVRVRSLLTWSSFIRHYNQFSLEMVRVGANSAPSREIAIRVPHSEVQSRDLGFSERAKKEPLIARLFNCALVRSRSLCLLALTHFRSLLPVCSLLRSLSLLLAAYALAFSSLERLLVRSLMLDCALVQLCACSLSLSHSACWLSATHFRQVQLTLGRLLRYYQLSPAPDLHFTQTPGGPVQFYSLPVSRSRLPVLHSPNTPPST